MSMRPLNLAGMTFGRLKVTSRNDVRQAGGYTWNCKCSCGVRKTFLGASLTLGRVKSCGCFRKDFAKEQHTKHGLHGTKEHKAWGQMKTRCTNKNRADYVNYGGRGIKVCDQWMNSFETFLADVGFAPAGTSLDRYPDNDGNYEPGNCRWATASQQRNNRRKAKKWKWSPEALARSKERVAARKLSL